MRARPSTGFSLLQLILVGAALAIATSACGSSVGGGGGGAVGTVGGKIDSACNAAYGEGCYAVNGVTSREACTGGKWTLIADCPTGTVCQEKIIAAGQAARTTECKSTAVTPGPDTTGGEDGKTNADGVLNSDTSNPNDTGKPSDTVNPGDIVNPGDTNIGQAAALIQCAQSKCIDQWASCQQDPACLGVVACFSGCTGDVISCASTCNGSGDDISLSLLQCAQSMCVGGGAVCGNGKCEGNELSTCPNDCKTGPVCGNGVCESGETSASCSPDCPVTDLCGNGKCDANETPINCNQDCTTAACCASKGYKCGDVPACNGNCGVCSGSQTCNSAFKCVAGTLCGNGVCDGSETTTSCPSDCPAATAICGDLTCQSTENNSSCAIDCPATGCGNGTCSTSENTSTCPQDCDPATKCVITYCKSPWVSCVKDSGCGNILLCIQNCAAGDSTCPSNCYSSGSSAGQSLYSATATCMQSNNCNATTTAVCGNGTCESGETNASCAPDCPATSGDPGCTANTVPGGYPTSICQTPLCGTKSGTVWSGGSDPYCCNTKWDGTCVTECGSAGATCP
jgi:hypothetical protein